MPATTVTTPRSALPVTAATPTSKHTGNSLAQRVSATLPFRSSLRPANPPPPSRSSLHPSNLPSRPPIPSPGLQGQSIVDGALGKVKYAFMDNGGTSFGVDDGHVNRLIDVNNLPLDQIFKFIDTSRLGPGEAQSLMVKITEWHKEVLLQKNEEKRPSAVAKFFGLEESHAISASTGGDNCCALFAAVTALVVSCLLIVMSSLV